MSAMSVLPSAAGPKSSAKSKKYIIKLMVSPAKLKKFPHAAHVEKSSRCKSSSQSSSTTPGRLMTEQSSTANALSDSNSTPIPNDGASVATMQADGNNLLPPPQSSKRKAAAGKSGSKRPLPQGSNALSKSRAKPGPKKKAKINDTDGDPPPAKAWGGVVPISSKLGPKANQGAINAGLRALDRSGKPCRKWERRSFQVRSFTGVVWDIPTWRAPARTAMEVISNDGTKSNSTPSCGSKTDIILGGVKRI